MLTQDISYLSPFFFSFCKQLLFFNHSAFKSSQCADDIDTASQFWHLKPAQNVEIRWVKKALNIFHVHPFAYPFTEQQFVVI